MNKLITRLMTAVLLITLLTPGITLAGDDSKLETLNAAFSVSPKGEGLQIPQGSTITTSANGEVTVAGPDGKTIFRTNDALTGMVSTPNGPQKASHVIRVPSDSIIRTKDNGDEKIIQTFFRNELILRIIDRQPSNSNWLDWDSGNPWIEWAAAYVGNLTYTYAYWVTPSSPPSPGSSVYDMLFTAIQYSSVAIMQPVLEWNHEGSGRWTGSAWYGVYGYYENSDDINVSSGDVIHGAIVWDGDQWYISFTDNTTNQYTSIYNEAFYGTYGLSVYCALEGGNIDDDDDVPGDTTFDYMSFRYQGNPVYPNWDDYYNIPDGLSGISVDIYSSSKVKLNTAN